MAFPARALAPQLATADALVFSEPVLGAFRKALRARTRQEISGSALRNATRLLCADARRAGVPIERLLVSVKATWQLLPEVRSLPLGDRRTELLDRVVTMCIEEYFAGSR